MPLLTTPEHIIFFAHVPKTGGSSVEEYLTRRFGTKLTMVNDNYRTGVRRRGLVSLPVHLTAVDLQELLPGRVDYSFAVVRDPLDRTLSQYRFQRGISWASKLDFSTWLRVMFAAKRFDPRVYQNHIRPQSDLVPEDAEIFRLEDGFEAMIARLDAVTGTVAPEEKVGHLLKRKREEISISRQDAALIAQFYDADYTRFGYARPEPAGLWDDRYAGLRAAVVIPFARAVVARQRHDWMR